MDYKLETSQIILIKQCKTNLTNMHNEGTYETLQQLVKFAQIQRQTKRPKGPCKVQLKSVLSLES